MAADNFSLVSAAVGLTVVVVVAKTGVEADMFLAAASVFVVVAETGAADDDILWVVLTGGGRWVAVKD